MSRSSWITAVVFLSVCLLQGLGYMTARIGSKSSQSGRTFILVNKDYPGNGSTSGECQVTATSGADIKVTSEIQAMGCSQRLLIVNKWTGKETILTCENNSVALFPVNTGGGNALKLHLADNTTENAEGLFRLKFRVTTSKGKMQVTCHSLEDLKKMLMRVVDDTTFATSLIISASVLIFLAIGCCVVNEMQGFLCPGCREDDPASDAGRRRGGSVMQGEAPRRDMTTGAPDPFTSRTPALQGASIMRDPMTASSTPHHVPATHGNTPAHHPPGSDHQTTPHHAPKSDHEAQKHHEPKSDQEGQKHHEPKSDHEGQKHHEPKPDHEAQKHHEPTSDHDVQKHHGT